MSEFLKVDMDKNRIKPWEWLWLWMFPTYEVVSDDYVFYFKKAFGKIYCVGEKHQ